MMKAMACGCLPVTSRQPRSGLPETIGAHDLGPPSRPLGTTIAADRDWQEDYVRALLAAARAPVEELEASRRRMKVEARARFSWAAVARQWRGLFEGVDE